jgi:hypothetical protein
MYMMTCRARVEAGPGPAGPGAGRTRRKARPPARRGARCHSHLGFRGDGGGDAGGERGRSPGQGQSAAEQARQRRHSGHLPVPRAHVRVRRLCGTGSSLRLCARVRRSTVTVCIIVQQRRALNVAKCNRAQFRVICDSDSALGARQGLRALRTVTPAAPRLPRLGLRGLGCLERDGPRLSLQASESSLATVLSLPPRRARACARACVRARASPRARARVHACLPMPARA